MGTWDAEVANAAAHWAKVYGVAIDPALVHAVIERESGHGKAPNYVAHHGVVPEPGGHVSYGPMQIYDSTLATVGVTFPGADLASHPGLGIWYGVKYLGMQLQRFGGDVAAAVSAYNAGPGNAKRNASGQFPNQSYVDFVLSFWQRNRTAISIGLPVLALAGAALWWLSKRRRAA
jgi:soluble lytic murein transglycosylase-like protein